MAGFLSSIIARVFIWWTIPIRILRELYLCLVDKQVEFPEEPSSKVGDKSINGDTLDISLTDSNDPSVDPEQRKLWQKTASEDAWWSDDSALSALRKLNPIRLRLVGEGYLKHVMGLENTWEDDMAAGGKFLSGASVCDVGCGGGILSEALADAGALVTGVDMLPAAIGIAKRHWSETTHNSTSRAPEYVCQSIEVFAERRAGAFDVVVCSEVLEHVTAPDVFVRHCLKLVRPGGCIVFTTINRTIWSLLACIIIPEDILGMLPRYLHRLHMCVKPEEIEKATDAAEMGFKFVKKDGLIMLPMGFRARDIQWMTSSFTGMAYSVVATRPE